MLDSGTGLRLIGLSTGTLAAETLEIGLETVSLGGEAPGALTSGFEFSRDIVSLGLNNTEHGGVIAVQMLDLCTSGV